jgi:phosphoglycolate phosphatase
MTVDRVVMFVHSEDDVVSPSPDVAPEVESFASSELHATVTEVHLFDGIELVIFDKDGTLIDFYAMWDGWARELGIRLDGAARLPVSGDVFRAIGFDPTTGHIAAGGPLAASTMSGIEDLIARVLRRWCPSAAAARRVVETAWFEPDPVASAVPLTDLPVLLGSLRARGLRIALATNDDRGSTERMLAGLGLGGLVDAISCADDGLAVKPAPDAVRALAERVGVAVGRTAVVGDLPVDLLMARAAGAGLAVGVLSGIGSREELEPLADAVLRSVAELV